MVDSIPEDAAFHPSNELGNPTGLHGGKVKNLRTLYGFRLLLKRKVAEYKQIIGKSPSEAQSVHVLWAAMDPDSKTKAMAMGLAEKT